MLEKIFIYNTKENNEKDIRVIESNIYNVCIRLYKQNKKVNVIYEHNLEEEEFINNIIILEENKEYREKLSNSSLNYNMFNNLMDSIIKAPRYIV